MKEINDKFWTREGERVRCDICPARCSLKDGEISRCLTKKNVDGRLVELNYGEVTALAVDPIEKKPLYHYKPTTQILSIGSWGCTLKCKFCQNWQISTQRPALVEKIEPENLVAFVVNNGVKDIAFTYNEPFVSVQWLIDVLPLLVEEGVDIVLVSNGVVNREVAEAVLPYVKAVALDLKGDRDFYKTFCGLNAFDTVIDFAKMCLDMGVWLEVIWLLIEGANDDFFSKLMGVYESYLKEWVPLHISAYYPAYKLHFPPTSPAAVMRFAEEASKSLKFVYSGNILDKEKSSTYCPKCGALLIERVGYEVLVKNLDMESGKCLKCGEKIEGVWGF